MYGRDVSLLSAPRIRKDLAHAPWISKDTQSCRSSRRLVRPSDRPERHPPTEPLVRANRPGTRVVDLDHVARSSARMPGGGDPEVSKRTVAPVLGSYPPRMDGCGLTWTRIPSNAPRRRTRWFSRRKAAAEIRPGARGYVLTRVPNRAAGFDLIDHVSQLSRGRSSTFHAHKESSHRSPCTPSRPPKASAR